jgi:PiT family inorganic phosphate transporter
MDPLALLLLVIAVALVFEYINGFHDTANSIATVVSTRVLTPRQAIVLAATTNLAGALIGSAVAKTITSGLVDSKVAAITPVMIISSLVGGILWNLFTWWRGLPSSSSHALIGGLCGSALASAHGNWSALIWVRPKEGMPWFRHDGIFYKVVIPMLTSPVLGFLMGFLLMSLLYILLRRAKPVWVSRVFGRMQLVSAAFMGFSHGQNDAQKTMGIITLALVAATSSGALAHAPGWLSFLHTPGAAPGASQDIPIWVKVTCALIMAAGTAAGGWRIIRTMGHQMVRLQPVHGFAAETAAASVLSGAAFLGMPVSTTHAITTSIMGVGCARSWKALNLTVVESILTAWVLTLPVTALLGYWIMRGFQAAGLH